MFTGEGGLIQRPAFREPLSFRNCEVFLYVLYFYPYKKLVHYILYCNVIYVPYKDFKCRNPEAMRNFAKTHGDRLEGAAVHVRVGDAGRV